MKVVQVGEEAGFGGSRGLGGGDGGRGIAISQLFHERGLGGEKGKKKGSQHKFC